MQSFLGLIFSIFLFLPLTVQAQLSLKPNNIPVIIPSAPTMSANAFILVDINSDDVIAERKIHDRVEPASLTKIMTGYAVFNELKSGNLSLDDLVTISEKAWKMPGSKMFIEVGKQVSVSDLIKGMVVQSGNDASVALAEQVAGSEEVFAQLMNKYARQIGMNNTNFMNATGLPHPEHYTTAYDLYLLTKALITEFPEEYQWYSQKKFTFNGISQFNRNKLLWSDPTVDGLKTGHTESAGYCLVSSAQRENMRLVSVVLGTNSSKTRIRESQKLLNYGFRFFETHQIYKAGQRLKDVKIWEGNKDLIGLGVLNDLYITLPRGQYNNLKIETTTQPELTAPIEKHAELGSLTISLEDKVLKELTLHALSEVEEGSFFKKLLDQIKLFFSNLFGGGDE